jgi:hypothetical protein
MTSPTTMPLLIQHLGTLHAAERVGVLVLAFGPFAVLATVVAWKRRRSSRRNPVAHKTAPEQTSRKGTR